MVYQHLHGFSRFTLYPHICFDADGYDNDGHDRKGNSRGHDDTPQGPGRHRAWAHGDDHDFDATPLGPGRHHARANGDKHDLDPTEEFHDDELGNAIDNELGWFDFDNLQEIDSDIKFSFMADTERLASEGRLCKAQAKILKRNLKDLEVEILNSSSAAFMPDWRRSAMGCHPYARSVSRTKCIQQIHQGGQVGEGQERHHHGQRLCSLFGAQRLVDHVRA